MKNNMNDKVEGLILKTQDYKDNDLMLFVLTKDLGIFSFIGKASKKITTKQHFFEGSTYEFIYDYKDNKTIYSIHGSKLIKNYYDLNDTKLFAFKNILFEAVLKSKELIEKGTYNNLIFVLDSINHNNKYLLGSLFMSYLCKLHGICPNVDECVVCKNKKVVSIANNLGGFVCLEHLSGLKPLDLDTLKRFRLITKADFKDYEVIKKNPYSLNDFKLISEFFIENSSINLKAYDFYLKIN